MCCFKMSEPEHIEPMLDIAAQATRLNPCAMDWLLSVLVQMVMAADPGSRSEHP